jgi:16S rRNA (adenine1518-N6/adenine1519-N6)-dimethyltransferase
LTQELAKQAKKVMAVEKDKNLINVLKNNTSKYQNLQILQGDIMINYHLSLIDDYKIVANLPYNIALAVIRKFLEEKNPPQTMVLMLQKEVAQRICSKKSSLSKITVEFYAKPEILFYVPKTSFWPAPKVDGAVIKITDIQKSIPNVDKELFFKILKIGFSHPRKTILNNFSQGLKLEKEKISQWLKNANVPCQKRPEELVLKQWTKLIDSFSF